jgi:tetratricopeptide (TPR) repeat protein
VEKVEASSVGSQRRKEWCGRAGESPLNELLDGLSTPMDEDESTGGMEGNGEAAVALFRAAVDQDPTYARAYHLMGNVLEFTGSFAEAAEAQRLAVQHGDTGVPGGGFAEAHLALGVALEAQQRTAEARFKAVAEAYWVLSDRERRATYDASGRRDGGVAAPRRGSVCDSDEEVDWDAFEIFAQMFAGGVYEQQAAREQRDRAQQAARELAEETGALPPPPSRGWRRRARQEQKSAQRGGVQRAGMAKKALKKQRKADRAAFAKLHKKAARKRKRSLDGAVE